MWPFSKKKTPLEPLVYRQGLKIQELEKQTEQLFTFITTITRRSGIHPDLFAEWTQENPQNVQYLTEVFNLINTKWKYKDKSVSK